MATASLPRQTADQKIQTILNDPCASFWVKDAIRALLRRDALDAAIDAEVLATVFQARVDEMLGR